MKKEQYLKKRNLTVFILYWIIINIVIDYPILWNDNFLFAAEPLSLAVTKQTPFIPTKNIDPIATKNIDPIATKNIDPITTKNIDPITTKNIDPITTKNIDPITTQNISTTEEKKIPANNISPMAEKHIFSPEPDSITNKDMQNQGNKLNDVEQNIDQLMQKVKRDMELTGIIITPVSKKAMILYKGKGAKKQVAELYNLGNSIDDYLLKDVFPNYVVIAQNNMEIKLGLFRERNDRPESSREMQSINPVETPPNGNISVQDGNPPANVAIPTPPNMGNSNSIEPPNPFAKAMKDAAIQQDRTAIFEDATNSPNGNNSNNMEGNPFLQAIQRARERQRSQ